MHMSKCIVFRYAKNEHVLGINQRPDLVSINDLDIEIKGLSFKISSYKLF